MKSYIIIVLFMYLSYSSLIASPGDEKWRFDLMAKASNPFTANSMVFIGGYAKNLYALDYSKNVKWSYLISSEARILLNEDLLSLTQTDNNLLQILNPVNGALIWKKNISMYKDYNLEVCISQGVVYVGTPDENSIPTIFALNASNGDIIWKRTTALGWKVGASNGVLYGNALTNQSYIDALTANTFNPIWHKIIFTGDWILIDSPANLSGKVYPIGVASGNFLNLYSLNGMNGSQNWLYTSGMRYNQGDEWSVISLDNTVLCCNFPKELHAISTADGIFKWKYTSSDTVYQPFSNGGYIYFRDQTNKLFSLDENNGSIKWSYPGSDKLTNPSVSKGLAFIGEGNDLVAIETYSDGFKEGKTSSKLPAKAFRTYPNPFKDRLNLSLPHKARIYNLNGQFVTDYNTGTYCIDTSNWRSGVYLIRCGNETKRIIKINY